VNEIDCPGVIYGRWLFARYPQMAEPFAPAAPAQREPFLTLESFDALMISCHALAPQYSMQHRATPAVVHLRQRAQPLPQLPVAIRPRLMSKRASRDSDQPAGATLRQMMVRHHIPYHLSLHRGR
jgi:hypothetical protein